MPKLDKTREERATVADVARRAGLTGDQGRAFVQAIVEELAIGREVRLLGLGVFRVTTTAARQFDTPVVSGGTAFVPARRVVRFRSAPTAQSRMNQDA